ncbi:hypothetical protein ACFPK9_10880 [Rubritalea spongiae]|uniref:TraB/GumN family protein n=1 Tax=Rubritalea spongiae TaxID=430797 RepID=A0ABW5DZX1_9BACT
MKFFIITLTAGLLCSYLLSAKEKPSTPVLTEEEITATEFIRVMESENQLSLQTAVTRYTRGVVTVDLIGAVHIADQVYYEALNKNFKNYQVVLFEMVGGEMLGQGRPIPKVAKGEGALGFLGTAYEKAQQLLKLSGQKDQIDYTAENLLHADLTIAEFQALQKERKESLLGFALQQALVSKPSKNQPSSVAFLLALMTKDANKLKRMMMDTLGDGDTNISKIAGDNVIISDRNKKCLDVMQQQVAEGQNKIGIFYGAAHFPDMEKRLKDLGFSQTEQTWLDAWVVPNK